MMLILIALLIFVFIGIASLTRMIEKQNTESWPVTQAVVLNLSTYDLVKSGARCVQLKYRYAIDGNAFVSDKISLSLAGTAACYRDEKIFDTLLMRFAPGAKIDIRYDPDDPGQSIIFFDDVDFSDIFLLIVSIGALAVASRAGWAFAQAKR
jgi:hypothetical protein